jgi:peptidoglycan/LPS O-acetylase OafA/YrhL
MNPVIPAALVASLTIIALFSFSMVATWSRERRREREAYYRSETLKRIADAQPSGGQFAIEFFCEEQKAAAQRRRESLKLAGLVTVATAIGLIAFIGTVGADHAYLVGLIPLLIGIALLTYAYLLAPKE